MADDLARFYHILGLEPDASPEAVKVAYRDCVDAWHPDRFTHSPERQQRAQARLRQINEAYARLRRHTPSTRQNRSAGAAPSPPPGSAGPETSRARASGRGSETRYRSRPHEEPTAQEPPTEPRESATPRGAWMQLSNESRFTVTTLYFSFIGVAIAAGCGISLGGMYFGPLGALCGVLASPLAGLIVAALSATAAAAISEHLGGFRGSLIGSALALLLPGAVCGAVMVWSISRAILGDLLPPLVDVALGGAFGAGCGMGLGAWTGKAISIALGELESG